VRRKLDNRPSSKRRGWAKFFLFALIGTLSLLLGGFLSFAQHVDNIQPAKDMKAADGIVVWTGKGGGRLEAGAVLLTRKKGERLLISGVNESNSIEAIRDLAGLSEKLAECCLDLDYEAHDTIGNARETANWASVLGYDHIILVTSAYHMPRAKAEISRTVGRMRITPYPVQRADARPWYKSWDRTKRLTQEYFKLLVTYAGGRNEEVNAPELVITPEN